MTAFWLILKGLPWKLIGYAAFILCACLLGWRINEWRHAYKALPEAQAALAAEVACEVPSQCATRVAALVERQKLVSETVVQGYEDELKSLRDRPIPVRTVRLCPDARAGGVPGAKPARPTDGTRPADGMGDGGTGADLGPDLYRLAGQCDEVAARLRGLQSWNKALSATN